MVTYCMLKDTKILLTSPQWYSGTWYQTTRKRTYKRTLSTPDPSLSKWQSTRPIVSRRQQVPPFVSSNLVLKSLRIRSQSVSVALAGDLLEQLVVLNLKLARCLPHNPHCARLPDSARLHEDRDSGAKLTECGSFARGEDFLLVRRNVVDKRYVPHGIHL
jgi:hypothetical protein